MKQWLMGLGLVLAAATAAPAEGWYEPAPGTAERAALMAAIRPAAEEGLGAPVEFVVHQLRVSGNVAFAALEAQRPGGAPIDLYRTPGYLRGEFYLDIMDPTGVQALLTRHGDLWVADDVVMTATDVWYIEYCGTRFDPVIKDVCDY